MGFLPDAISMAKFGERNPDPGELFLLEGELFLLEGELLLLEGDP